jgi:3-hydroxyacyl-[acyl-carrier-protein] dehydratase
MNESDKPIRLDIFRILQILPHRFPFVLVEQVHEPCRTKAFVGTKPSVSTSGSKDFPQRPILPGVIILEALSQLGAILAYASDPGSGC